MQAEEDAQTVEAAAIQTLAKAPAPANIAPNWHPDPLGGTKYRYWDGTRWTEHVSGAPSAQTPETGSGGEQVVYVKTVGNGMAVAALTCGIVGAIFGLIPILFFIALPLGILAVIFGLVGRRRAGRDPSVGRKTMATWGIVTGLIALALGIVGIVIVSDAANDLDRDLKEIDRQFQEDLNSP